MRTLLLCLTATIAAAQTQPPTHMIPYVLDKNHVKATIFTVNNKFWSLYSSSTAAYEVPKGRGTHAQFCNSIWIGGLDAGNQLRMTANTYRQSGTDYWPGPLDTTNIGAYTPSNTSVYNKLWKADCNDINAFATAYNSGSVAANTYTIPPGILNYPAKGIAKFQKNLEPFYDSNGDGLYNPQLHGDYPLIRGHQQILGIFNDQLFPHGETMAPAMGLEIHERSYAFSDPNLPDSMQAVNYSTFYHYTIYNRSSTSYHNVFISDWSDVDLGYFLDDYIGTDTVNAFTYCYNGHDTDITAWGVKGYGTKPPVVSHALLFTNCSNDGIDNNHNQTVDEPGEHFLMDRSTYYFNNIGSIPPAMTNPATAQHYYNLMSGYWKDGTAFTQGGNGYGGSTPAKYVYTGDPSQNTGWTETSAGNSPGDRRVIMSSGPFSLPAGAKIEWGFAVVFSQDTSQHVNTISQFNSRVKRDVRNVRLYHDSHLAAQCTPAVLVGLPELSAAGQNLRLYPSPATGKVTILLEREITGAGIAVYDISGREIMNTGANGMKTELDVSALPAGVYAVVVGNSQERAKVKFVKAD
jgi:hypothetical protein